MTRSECALISAAVLLILLILALPSRKAPAPQATRSITFCSAFLNPRIPPEIYFMLSDADCSHPIVDRV